MNDSAEIIARLCCLEEMINAIRQKLDNLHGDDSIGDWITEKETMRLTGLSRSTLFRLRNEHKLTYSTLKTKKIFYRKSDLEKLLNKNEIEK